MKNLTELDLANQQIRTLKQLLKLKNNELKTVYKELRKISEVK